MAKLTTSKGDFYYSPKFLYVGIKQIDRRMAFDNFKLLLEILSSKGLKVGPFLGTLLGIVRDNDFIEWDEDIDLFIMKEQEDILLDCLWELKGFGFELVRYERRGLYSFMRNGEYIDFYVMYKIGENLRCSGGSDYVFENYLTDTIVWNFKGIEVEIPKDYDEFLTFQYGDWCTPIKYANFDMGFIEKSKLYIINKIKNNIPDSMYFYLLKRYHHKHLEKFKNKCKIKGKTLPADIQL